MSCNISMTSRAAWRLESSGGGCACWLRCIFRDLSFSRDDYFVGAADLTDTMIWQVCLCVSKEGDFWIEVMRKCCCC